MKSRNMCEQIQIIKKAEPSFSTFCILFVVASQVFAVEKIGLKGWKAYEQANLIIKIIIKIE